MDSIRKLCKGFWRVLLVLGVVWLLLVGVVESARMNAHDQVAAGSMKNNKDMKTEKRSVNYKPKMDLNFMSKRRVPNGPDPIHNRRAGNSRRPPGQASKGELVKP